MLDHLGRAPRSATTLPGGPVQYVDAVSARRRRQRGRRIAGPESFIATLLVTTTGPPRVTPSRVGPVAMGEETRALSTYPCRQSRFGYFEPPSIEESNEGYGGRVTEPWGPD